MRRQTVVFLTAILVISTAVAALAQTSSTTGEIRGVVYDEQGAVIVGAAVEVRNQDTGLTRSVTTNDRGRFRALLLPVGMYTVTVEKERFKKSERQGIEVNVGDLIDLDTTLEVGEFTTVVTITGDAPIIETSRTTVSSVVSQDLIENLPIDGRDYRDFVLITPTTGVSSRAGVTVGGSRGMYTNLTIDGADSNAPFFAEQNGGEINATFTVSQESIKEFRVLNNGFSAEFGRSIGGLINVVTKSGTNEFRGTGFLLWQNESLVADQLESIDFGEDSEYVEQGEFKRTQFGGSLGGPLEEDKSFFFISADMQKFTVPHTVRFNWSAAERAANPALAAMEGTFESKDDDTVFFGKIDYEINDSHSLTARFSWADVNQKNGQNFFADNSESMNGDETEVSTSLVASLTSFLSDNMINEFRFQWATDEINRSTNEPDLPQLRVDGVGRWGSTWFLPIEVNSKRLQLTNNFNWLLEDHDLKIGLDWNRTTTDEIFIGNARGQLRFTSLNNYLNDNVSYALQRVPLGGRSIVESGTFKAVVNEFALYVQDKWQPTAQLTIDAGLRWEGTYNPDPPTTNPLLPLTGQLYDDTNNWQPRVGLAYDLRGDGKTVIRAAGGLFYGRTPSILYYNPFNGNGIISVPFQYIPGSVVAGYYPPYDVNGIVALYASGAGGGLDVDYFDPDFEEAEVWRFNAGIEHELIPDTSIGVDMLWADGDKLFRRHDINMFAPTPGAATNGRDLYQRSTRPYANFGRIQETISSGKMEYLAVTTMLKSRMAYNVSMQASYTWSRDKDDDSNERSSGGTTYTESFNPDADFGLSDRDRTHRVVASAVWKAPFDFTVSGIFTWMSGRPYSANWGTDLNGDAITSDRAAPGSGGTIWVARNTYRQDSWKNLDLRISKVFNIDRYQLEGIFEVFNIFNWESATGVFATSRFSSFGLTSSYQSSRRLQIGGRIRF